MGKDLVSCVKEFLFPTVKVDHNRKTFEFVNEGIFGYHLTEAFYVLNGYEQIGTSTIYASNNDIGAKDHA